MSVSGIQTAQRLPSYLPAIYRDDQFVGQYLWAFEQLLLDLEQRVGDLATLFDPLETPAEFLPWLSSWVAFTLRADLSLPQQRNFIARIVPLYRRRGTKDNLEELLSIFTRGLPTIVESDDTGPAHRFRITLRLNAALPEDQRRQIAIAHALIDLEKPAHTDYDLDLLFSTMRIGTTSHIGVDTLLGTEKNVESDATLLVAAPKATLTGQRPTSKPKHERPKSKPAQEHPKPKPKQARSKSEATPEHPKSKATPEHPKSKSKQARPKSKPKQARPKSKSKQARPKSKPKQARPKSR